MQFSNILNKKLNSKALSKLYATLLNACFIGMFLSACNTIDTDVITAKNSTPVIINTNINDLKKTPSQILLNNQTNRLEGWNHVETYPEEFVGLSFPSINYQTQKYSPSENTKGIYSTTLIKKIDDWHHQHANGVTAEFPIITFQNIAGIELVIKINSTGSNIPSGVELYKTYSKWLNEKELKKLDDANVHLSLALVDVKSASSKENGLFNADYLLSLDIEKHLDQWLYIFIPREQLTTYNELNYKRNLINRKDSALKSVSNFRLMAETMSTKVVRNFIADSFDKNVPKQYKEIEIELNYLGIVKLSSNKL